MAEELNQSWSARQFLAQTLGLGAVGVGGYLTYQSAKSDLPTFQSLTANRPILTNPLVQAQRQYASNISSSDYADRIRQRVSGISPDFGALAETEQVAGIRNAYIQAMRSVETYKTDLIDQAHMAFPGITSRNQAISYVADQLKNVTDPGRTGLHFISNLEALAGHARVTGQIPAILSQQMAAASAPRIMKEKIAGASLDQDVQAQIQRIRQALGTDTGWEAYRYTGDAPGSTLSIEFKGGVLGDDPLAIDVAESLPRGSVAGFDAAEELVAVGRRQEHLFKTRPIAVVDPVNPRITTTLNHTQGYLRRLADSLTAELQNSHRKTRSSVNYMLDKFHQEYFKEEWLTGMTVRGGQYVPSPGQARLLNALKGQVTVGIDSPKGLLTGRQIENVTMDRILQSGLLTADTAPDQMAGGGFRLSSVPSHQSVFSTALDDPARRTASQMLAHTATAPSAGATAYNMQFHVNTRTGTQDHLRRLLGPSAAAMGVDLDQLVPVRATVIDPETEAGRALRRYGLFDESGRYISEHARAFERVSPTSLTVSEATDTLHKLAAGNISDIPAGALQEGHLLGYDPMGSPVTVGAGMNLTQVRRMSGGGYQVIGETTSNPEAFKLFGTKAMMSPMSREEAGGMLRSVLRDQVRDEMINNQTQMVHVAELRKHRLIQKQLVFTALSEQIEAKHGGRFDRRLGRLLDTLATPGADIDLANQRFMQRAWGLGKSAGLSTEQLGGVFGYVGSELPGMMDPAWKAKAMSPAEEAAVSRGIGWGGTALVAHGESLAGQNIRAGVEPRFFDILGSPIHAEWAPKATAELVERIKLSNPNYELQQELTTSMKAILQPGSVDLPAGAARMDISALSNEHLSPSSSEFIAGRPGGTIVKAGEREVYVPYMRPSIKLETGGPKMPEAWNVYGDYLRELKAAQGSAPSTLTALQDKYAQEFASQYQRLQTGTGGLQRSKHIPGTRLLTGIGGTQRRAGGRLNPWEVGVHPDDLKEMLNEMDEMGQGFGPAERGKMLSGDIPVPSLTFRHPATAQTSLMATHLRADPSVPRGTAGFASDAREVSMSVNGKHLKNKWIDFGVARLERGDFDADFFGVSPIRAARDEINSFVHHQMKGGPGISMIQEDAIRWQILEDAVWKPKRSGRTMAQAIREAGNVGRLSRGMVGSISNAVSGLRAAVVSSASMNEADKRAAMAMLFAAEEFPISAAKHMGGDVEKLSAMLSRPVQAATATSADDMAGQLESMFKNLVDFDSPSLDPIAKQALEGKGIEVSIAGQSKGTIADMGIGRLAKGIAGSWQEANSGEGISVARYRRLMAGRGQKGITAKEAFEVIANPRGATALFQPEAFSTAAGVGAGASRTTKVLSTINQLAAAGKKIIPHAKPLAIGLGAMLGIGAVLSSPETPMKGAPTPRPSMSGNVRHRDITPELMTAQQNLGEPRAPNVVNQNRQMISPGRGAKLRVKSTMSENADLDRLNSRLANTGSNARIRINDNRRQMRPYEVSDMMGAA